MQFLSTYQQPVRFSPLPFEAFAYVAPSYTGPLFFEQRYYGQAKQLLEVRATAVPTDMRGMLRLLANDAHLLGAHYMEIALEDSNTQALATGERITLPTQPGVDALPAFATPYEDAVAFTGLPYEVSIVIDAGMAGRELYFERRYLDAQGVELEIRSTVIPAAALGKRVRLLLDSDPLECAARVELAIVDEYRAYKGNCEGLPPEEIKFFDFTFDFTFE